MNIRTHWKPGKRKADKEFCQPFPNWWCELLAFAKIYIFINKKLLFFDALKGPWQEIIMLKSTDLSKKKRKKYKILKCLITIIKI